MLNHVLHPTITPVLVLLEERDEAGSGDSCQPSRSHTLHRTPEKQGRQVHAQGRADQGNATLDHPKTRKGPADRNGQLLSTLAGELNAVHRGDLHDHLGVHGGCSQQINAWQRCCGHNTGADPGVAIDDPSGFVRPLPIEKVTAGGTQIPALEKDVVGEEFISIAVEHGRQASHQQSDFSGWLERTLTGARQ